MKGTAKSKVVTSGRLTGGVKVQSVRRRVVRATPNPGPAACPEPAYSLYSTDSEDQVTSLHKGLDRCAAVLSGILQAEKAEALPSLPRAARGGAAKSRPSTSLGKKTTKKLLTKTDQKSSHSVRRGPGSTVPTTYQSAVPSAHSEVKLHPPQEKPHTLLQPHLPPSHSQTLQHLSPTTPSPQPQTSTPPPQTSLPPPYPTPHSGRLLLPQTDCQAASEAPHTHCKVECDSEEESVPVRDSNTQSTVHTCIMKMSNMQPEPGQVNKVPRDTHSRDDCEVKTAQRLQGDLKALIAAQGSVAETLLGHLEQTVSSTLMNIGSSNIQTEPDLSSLHNQNSQLRRRVRILNQQLKEREKAERQHNMETLCNSEVLTLQEELTTAQSRQQELQDALTELQKALQCTQSQLRDREAENALLKTDLKATTSRLLESEQEKSELASLAQQRLEEIGNLNRILQSRDSLDCPAVVDSSVSDTQHFNQDQHRQEPAEPPTDRIIQYLMSLGRPEAPTHTEHVRVAAERDGNTLEQKKLTSIQLRDTSPHPDVRSQRGDGPAETSARHQNSYLDQSHCLDEVQSCGQLEEEHRRQLSSTLSQCDVESDWSTRSGSVFDARDEAAFRAGLAALDASIASLQKTIQLDLGR